MNCIADETFIEDVDVRNIQSLHNVDKGPGDVLVQDV